jgi:hypothetical protein
MKKTLIQVLFAAFAICATSQVRAQYSQNIVGYINLRIYTGDNLIANQLSDGINRLNDILGVTNGPIQDGATFTKWDPAANAFLPASTYSASSGQWSINYGLTFGEGGVLHSASLWTNTFMGDVYPPAVPYIVSGNLDPANYWHPNYAAGLYLISSPIPIDGPIDEMFPYLVGRAPQDGEWVKLLDPATQVYLTTTFHAGTGWDNGDPTLSIGQSAWVSLVPEPVALNLCGICAAMLLLFRSRKSA